MSEEKLYLSNGSDAPPKPAKVLDWARGVGAKMVDLKFIDLLGTWQHCSFPIAKSTRAFRGRLRLRRLVDPRLAGDQRVGHAGDDPDATTAILDPFTEAPTISIICDIVDPITREDYDRDPRLISQRAEAYLVDTGIADTGYFGPEAEFFIFDEVRYDSGPNRATTRSTRPRATGTRAAGPGVGYTIREKHGYFPVAPHDTFQDLRTEMVLILEGLGIDVEAHHHEVATAGQCEIDMKFTTA